LQRYVEEEIPTAACSLASTADRSPTGSTSRCSTTFTPAEAASPLLAIPYSLRHAAVSSWLRTSGDVAQVAEWAGPSSAVLLNVYAKCLHGTEDETLAPTWDATRG
jgi:hypothetical protein